MVAPGRLLNTSTEDALPLWPDSGSALEGMLMICYAVTTFFMCLTSSTENGSCAHLKGAGTAASSTRASVLRMGL